MIVGGAALYAYRRKHKHDVAMAITAELGAAVAVHSSTKSTGNDLVLDAEGGVLRDALNDGGVTGGTGMQNEDNKEEEEENGMEDKEII